MKPLDRKLKHSRQWDHFVADGVVSRDVLWTCRAVVDRHGAVSDVRQNLRALISNWYQHQFDIALKLEEQKAFHEMRPKMAREIHAFIERLQALRFG